MYLKFQGYFGSLVLCWRKLALEKITVSKRNKTNVGSTKIRIFLYIL